MSMQVPPVARAEMMIRRPAAVVYGAFVDPAVTSRFWFTRGSQRLEEGALVTWFWDMYGASAQVSVKSLEPDRRIQIEWPTPVEWTFTPRHDGSTTMVVITASGFTGSDDEQVAQAIDAMGGFSLTLAGAKAFLEHGIELNLVADHNPDAHVKPDA
ncbi:SRPBCC family protein [Aquabacterium sp.]|uniref:SRPBCC family protein n=1 Tax=Aquabacterium sp. TaxID=1872578 RepID=UPI002BE053B8|nr:SRPBCC family protein [Aquabacterium sp.]HSW03931.1 SRPBCC family protein [Aquabacterium sp.]